VKQAKVWNVQVKNLKKSSTTEIKSRAVPGAKVNPRSMPERIFLISFCLLRTMIRHQNDINKNFLQIQALSACYVLK